MRKKIPGENILKKLSTRFQNKHKGSIITVDPKTGKYLLGKDELAVALKAKKMFPGVHFSVFRIGYPAVHKFRYAAPPTTISGILKVGCASATGTPCPSFPQVPRP